MIYNQDIWFINICKLYILMFNFVEIVRLYKVKLFIYLLHIVSSSKKETYKYCLISKTQA